MAGENTKIIRLQGGDVLQVKTGGAIVPNSGTQAAAVIDVTGGLTVDAESRTAVNAILAALRGVGIIAP